MRGGKKERRELSVEVVSVAALPFMPDGRKKFGFPREESAEQVSKRSEERGGAEPTETRRENARDHAKIAKRALRGSSSRNTFRKEERRGWSSEGGIFPGAG